MRAMWADLDTRRPVLVLTGPEVGRYLRNVTVAPITSRVRASVRTSRGRRRGEDAIDGRDYHRTAERRSR